MHIFGFQLLPHLLQLRDTMLKRKMSKNIKPWLNLNLQQTLQFKYKLSYMTMHLGQKLFFLTTSKTKKAKFLTTMCI